MPGREVNDMNCVRRKQTDKESDNPDVVLDGRTTQWSSVSIEVIVVSSKKYVRSRCALMSQPTLGSRKNKKNSH